MSNLKKAFIYFICLTAFNCAATFANAQTSADNSALIKQIDSILQSQVNK